MAKLPGTLDVYKELKKLKNDSTKETTTLETENDLRTRGSALLQKMDFFSLYGIPEYKPSLDNSENNYLGFMPIIIRNASFYGDEVGEKTWFKMKNPVPQVFDQSYLSQQQNLIKSIKEVVHYRIIEKEVLVE